MKKRIATPVLLAAFLIFTLAGLVYANGLRGDFIFDNRAVLLGDLRLQEASWTNLKRIWTEDYWSPNILGLYRPVTTTTFLLNYSVLGNEAERFGYNLFNLLIHACNGVLLFFLLRKLSLVWWGALLGSLLFVAHPLGTEAVTNTVGRSDLLAGFFILASVLAYDQFRDTGKSHWALACGVLTLLGGLSKETAWVIPGLLVAYEMLQLQPESVRVPCKAAFWKKAIESARCWAPCGVLPVLIILGWRAWMYQQIPVQGVAYTDNPLLGADFFAWQLTAAEIFFRGLWLCILPLHLSVDYSYAQILPVIFPPSGWQDWGAIGLTLLFWAQFPLLFFLCRRAPRLVFFWALVLMAYLPGGNFILIASSIFGERFWYIPLVGLAGVGALGVQWLLDIGKRHTARVVGVVCILCIILLGWRTHLRNADWKSDIRLFSSAVEVCPESARAHSSLAAALYLKAIEEGRLGQDIDQILRHSRKAVEIIHTLPEEYFNVQTLLNYASYLMEAHKLSQSADYLQEARSVTSSLMESIRQKELLKKNESEGKQLGLASARISTNLESQICQAHARVLLLSRQEKEALRTAGLAVSYAPTDASHYLLQSVILFQIGGEATEPAAVAVTKAILLGRGKSREQAWSQALKVYDSLPGKEGMLYEDDQGLKFNTGHVRSRQLIDAAFLELHGHLTRSGDLANADRIQMIATSQFGCAPDLFEEKLEGGSRRER